MLKTGKKQQHTQVTLNISDAGKKKKKSRSSLSPFLILKEKAGDIFFIVNKSEKTKTNNMFDSQRLLCDTQSQPHLFLLRTYT